MSLNTVILVVVIVALLFCFALPYVFPEDDPYNRRGNKD
jgi:hypothetical protein